MINLIRANAIYSSPDFHCPVDKLYTKLSLEIYMLKVNWLKRQYSFCNMKHTDVLVIFRLANVYQV